MSQLAIRGHATRGSEVIELLEMLGGNNSYSRYCGYNTSTNTIYYIDFSDHNFIKMIEKPSNNSDFIVFTLEEFEEKYPYKVGDKVIMGDFPCVITSVTWDPINNDIFYYVKGDDFRVSADVNSLKPYKEQEIMSEKINIAELLKDCPKGTKLYSPLCGECTLYDVNDYNIRISTPNKDTLICLYHDGRYCANGEIMLFPKGKTTWEGFVPPCKFKDGDVLVHTQNDRFIMSIYKSNKNEKLINTHAILLDREEGLSVGMQLCCYTDNVRFATKEEKEKLFQAIKDNGYEWNPETKTLVKLPKFKVGDRLILKDNPFNISSVKIKAVTKSQYILENEAFVYISGADEKYVLEDKFNITTLKPFDKVLVRCGNAGFWNPQFFAKYSPNSKFPFTCTYNSWSQCIPYEGNEHLLGTTDDCDEYFKVWE